MPNTPIGYISFSGGKPRIVLRDYPSLSINKTRAVVQYACKKAAENPQKSEA